MPARGLRLRCHLLTLVAACVFVPGGVKAQNSVTLKATVRETVVLSVAPNSIGAATNTVQITLSSTGSSVIRLPLIVRSNSGFKVSVVADSTKAVVMQLSVVEVRATGSLVSPAAIGELNVPQQFDLRGLDESALGAPNPPDLSQPLLVVSGPRISLGGTVQSSNNALEITVLIRLKPELRHGSPVHLTFAATPEPLIP